MAKKKRVLKVLLSVFLILIVIVGIGLAVLLTNLNSIAKKGIVKVLSYVLEVDVSLKKVNISLLKGTCTLEGFVIGNPEGFKTEDAFSVKRVDVAVDIKSFGTDLPIIKLISMKNPEVTLEQGLHGSNLTKMIDNASRFSGKETKEAESAEGQKEIKIDKIIVEGAKVSLSAPVLQGRSVTFPLPKIEIRNIGGKKKPVSVAESIRLFFVKILNSALDAGKGIIPADMYEMLQTSLKTAKETVSNAAETIKEQVRGGKKTLMEQKGKVGSQSKKGGKKLEEGVEDISRGIKGIFKKDRK